MLDEVRAAFPTFTDKFEGKLPFMYLDVLGLVTTGRGNLIDPLPYALVLPWQHTDGRVATSPEITSEWTHVKSFQQMRKMGGGHFINVTSLRLTPEAVDALTFRELDRMWANLTARFLEVEGWPATAQLGLVSMAWAMGPSFRFPAFQAAAAAEDWAVCADQCKMNEAGNPGLVPRNAMNRRLFLAARDGVDLAEVLAA